MITEPLTKGEACRIYDTKEYENWSDREKVAAMLYGKLVCMPFDVFHAAIERVLDRPVFTHEFGYNFDGIVKEFEGTGKKPNLEEVIEMIPEEKRIIIFR
jgi:hypothetical protein